MAVALDPAQALGYVTLLSRDIGAIAIVDSGGELLAGDAGLGDQIRAGDALDDLLTVSSASHTIGVQAGLSAHRALLEYDLTVALRAMG